MRYPASEKLEIIRTVETSHLPVRRTLAQDRHPQVDLLRLARSLCGGRPRRRSKIASRGQSASGTASPTRSATGSLSSRSRSRSCRRVRSPSPSPIVERPSSPRPASIGS